MEQKVDLQKEMKASTFTMFYDKMVKCHRRKLMLSFDNIHSTTQKLCTAKVRFHHGTMIISLKCVKIGYTALHFRFLAHLPVLPNITINNFSMS